MPVDLLKGALRRKAVVTALRRLDPEHVEDYLRVFGIVLVQTVVQGLKGSRARASDDSRTS
ncbi:hypothetical protein ASC97_31535 [Rhizobium sp. Root1203]|uniref:hypothetical protein n=1 Tax=Rhizobium sp. Root1203 TaxID=1736427 RepID=UPI00070E7CDF|nr:hypothetical protein [Rhizobium sp. Root1203]KQV14889.1 hypothetical protein ASC97_31535 [Rhizobium sp. Root1203]